MRAKEKTNESENTAKAKEKDPSSMDELRRRMDILRKDTNVQTAITGYVGERLMWTALNTFDSVFDPNEIDIKDEVDMELKYDDELRGRVAAVYEAVKKNLTGAKNESKNIEKMKKYIIKNYKGNLFESLEKFGKKFPSLKVKSVKVKDGTVMLEALSRSYDGMGAQYKFYRRPSDKQTKYYITWSDTSDGNARVIGFVLGIPEENRKHFVLSQYGEKRWSYSLSPKRVADVAELVAKQFPNLWFAIRKEEYTEDIQRTANTGAPPKNHARNFNRLAEYDPRMKTWFGLDSVRELPEPEKNPETFQDKMNKAAAPKGKADAADKQFLQKWKGENPMKVQFEIEKRQREVNRNRSTIEATKKPELKANLEKQNERLTHEIELLGSLVGGVKESDDGFKKAFDGWKEEWERRKGKVNEGRSIDPAAYDFWAKNFEDEVKGLFNDDPEKAKAVLAATDELASNDHARAKLLDKFLEDDHEDFIMLFADLFDMSPDADLSKVSIDDIDEEGVKAAWNELAKGNPRAAIMYYIDNLSYGQRTVLDDVLEVYGKI